MNLKEEILKEHSKVQCDRIVKWIGSDKKKFSSLMKLFFEGEYRITQRAAWPMSYCAEKYPILIQPYFKKMIDNLNKSRLHPAVTRNTVRLLQTVEIPEKYEGQVMTLCFNFIQDPKQPAAIKAFSLTTLERLSKKFPEIIRELALITKERWDEETPAFRARAKWINNDI